MIIIHICSFRTYNYRPDTNVVIFHYNIIMDDTIIVLNTNDFVPRKFDYEHCNFKVTNLLL